MRKKQSEFENPVLNFSAAMAPEGLIVEQIDKHYANGFKYWKKGDREIHEGMLKAMKGNFPPDQVRKMLYARCNGEKSKANSLLLRYIRILDSESRRKHFLDGSQSFWEASRISRYGKDLNDLLESRLHGVAVVALKLGKENGEIHEKYDETVLRYRQDRGWV
jgi:hypothetical protein